MPSLLLKDSNVHLFDCFLGSQSRWATAILPHTENRYFYHWSLSKLFAFTHFSSFFIIFHLINELRIVIPHVMPPCHAPSNYRCRQKPWHTKADMDLQKAAQSWGLGFGGFGSCKRPAFEQTRSMAPGTDGEDHPEVQGFRASCSLLKHTRNY